MITLEQGVNLVWYAFEGMVGGEIYVKNIPSMKVTDIARAVAPDVRQDIVGVRPGEKLHEQMIGFEDALYTCEYKDYCKILPAIYKWSEDPERINGGGEVAPDCTYCLNSNVDWMSLETLRDWIRQSRDKLGKL